MFDTHTSTPWGSLALRSKEEESWYLERLNDIPSGLLDIILSDRTGYFIRGVLKTSGLSLDLSPRLALVVLDVCFGKITITQLPDVLMGKMKIPKEKSLIIAKEIEKDLFAPVMMELGKVQKRAERPAGKSENTTSPSPSLSRRGDQRPEHSGMSNVLDLKEKKYPPAPPPIR